MRRHSLAVMFWLCGFGSMAFAASELASLQLSADFRIVGHRELPCAAAHPDRRVALRTYEAFGALEWQTRLVAPSDRSSAWIEDLPSADFRVHFPTHAATTLHWNEGSHAKPTDFRPQAEELEVAKPRRFESFGGRSSDGVMPYFNLATSGGGLIVALGWSGDWRATWERDEDGTVRVTAGLKQSHFRLPAGETVRMPSVLIMSYTGDWVRGQNQFRRLMLHHFTPPSHDPLTLMPVAASVHGMLGFNATTEANLVALARDIAALKLPIDTFWLDAGWNEGGFPQGQGNPQPDPIRFPAGLAPVGREVERTGLRFLTWFEPERAMRGTWLDRHHPEWLLEPTKTPDELRYQEKDGFRLLDFGNPAARAWALESVTTALQTAKIGVYRQDFNEYPSYFWQTDEPEDQRGLREVRYVTGLYDFLDQLAKQNPGLILDNCASGGRRLDFEMMRRCVTLWRSDSCWGDAAFPRNVQGMTHGLSSWLPLHGLGANASDDISLRSGMGVWSSFAVNYRDPRAVEELRRHLEKYHRVRAAYAADYYPLTAWTDDPQQWLAFQFDDPVSGRGVVQAFRGPISNDESTPPSWKPHGFDPNRRYRVFDWDHPEAARELTGAEIAETGFSPARSLSARAVVWEYLRLPSL